MKCPNLSDFYLKTMAVIGAVILVFGISSGAFAQAEVGKISGQIVDAQTGEALPGATIMLQNTAIGAASDLDGDYSLSKVPAGEYTAIISMIGYAKTTVTSVRVSAGGITKINMALKPDAIAVDNIIVEAKQLKNTEASLLKDRQKSNSVSDAISAESMARTGSGDAAEAMTRVTGASVVGGKYVLIRGLGERYSSAQLNGAELPSADPDKKAFQMDLLPSNLLENIVTIKSFSPDQPGSFSGGIIDIGTRAYPEQLTLKLSTSGASVDGTSHNSKFLTYSGGGSDWTGRDDGSRDMPDEVRSGSIPLGSEALTSSEKAHELDRISKAFNNVMAPKAQTAPINRNFALSLGNQTSLFGKKLGYLGSLSYNRSYSFYENAQFAKWQLTSRVEDATTLGYSAKFKDTQGSSEVIWGGLAMASLKLSPKHEISANFLYTQSGESSARYLTGELPEDLSEDQIFETRVLKYTERNLKSYQLHGNHDLSGFFGLKAEWLGAYSKNTQDEPDLRYFSDRYELFRGDTVYGISTNTGFTYPQRIWRNLSENNSSIDLKLTKSFRQWNDLTANLITGAAYSEKKRIYRQRIFEYNNDDQSRYGYDGDPGYYFSNDNIGIMDSSYGFYRFANYIVERSTPRGNYDGTQKISAAFAMVEMPLSRHLRFTGGARFEQTHIDCATQDTSLEKGKLRNNDLLPSAGLIYQLGENMNIRAAFGKTLARPTFRELAPYATYEFVGDYTFIGNPNLKRTLIENYDLRWEWFQRPGEIYAISGFYKSFLDPIERAILNNNGEVNYQNVSHGVVSGVEFELRERLDRVHNLLRYFQLGANLSLIHSRVRIPDSEYAGILASDSSASHYRPLWGQSPYILNWDLTYDSPQIGTSVNLNYNISGKRLYSVATGVTPDVYEMPQGLLGMTINQRFFHHFDLKFSAKNMLDSSVKKVQSFKGHDYIAQEYSAGKSISLGVSYNFN